MTAQLIDGKLMAANIRSQIKEQVEDYVKAGNRRPALAVILVGEDPASQIYVRNKHKACEDCGMESLAYTLDASISQTELNTLIDKLNADEKIDGILVQFPLPEHLNESAVVERISASKDVDGFHPYNVGRLVQRIPYICAATPHGVMTMLRNTLGKDLKGKSAVVVGASNIVGRPMALELLLAGCTVTVTHRFTPMETTKAMLKQADIAVVAVGKPRFIDGTWFKDGACVIDVGINRLESGKLCGDVDFDKAVDHVGFITPVPGGVGPMTIATLMQNTLTAYESHIKK